MIIMFNLNQEAWETVLIFSFKTEFVHPKKCKTIFLISGLDQNCDYEYGNI